MQVPPSFHPHREQPSPLAQLCCVSPSAPHQQWSWLLKKLYIGGGEKNRMWQTQNIQWDARNNSNSNSPFFPLQPQVLFQSPSLYKISIWQYPCVAHSPLSFVHVQDQSKRTILYLHGNELYQLQLMQCSAREQGTHSTNNSYALGMHVLHISFFNCIVNIYHKKCLHHLTLSC